VGESAEERASGRWRMRGRIPTRGPRGPVRWWERPAPGGNELLWEAVIRVHEARIVQKVSISALVDHLAYRGHKIRRETLSRVLNGLQPTSWETVDELADLLGVSLADLHERRWKLAGPPEAGGAPPSGEESPGPGPLPPPGDG
jgi:hypothetical protein